MAKRINQLLSILMGGIAAVYLGYCIWQYCDYRTHVTEYISYSAPWYLGLQVYGIMALTALAVCLLAKFIIRKKIKQ